MFDTGLKKLAATITALAVVGAQLRRREVDR
jgi:hypothetical protein